jgi:gliding motility associated protien GldN
MKTLKSIFFTLAILLASSAMAQVIDYNKTPGPEEDGIFIKHHVFENRAIPYVHIREADVMWTRRYWRKMDLREKRNHPLYYPTNSELKNRQSLTNLLFSAVKNEGSITAYDDEEFKRVLTPQEVQDKLFKVDTIIDIDIDTGLPFDRLDTIKIEAKDVLLYLIKEDWVFDKARSVMEVRILGICPVADKVDELGSPYKEPLFWIWYPEARQTLANAEVFNPQNSAERRSFEEIFQTRQFSSYIMKEENVYDRSISEYKKFSPMDQLLEADRIKEDIRNFESDLWEY